MKEKPKYFTDMVRSGQAVGILARVVTDSWVTSEDIEKLHTIVEQCRENEDKEEDGPAHAESLPPFDAKTGNSLD